MSCEPSPMCLAAIYWARPDKVYFANSKDDAASIGCDDVFIYDKIKTHFSGRKIPMIQLMRHEALKAFKEWEEKMDKVKY